MAGDLEYKQLCERMQQAGYMNHPIAHVIKRLRDKDDLRQAMFSSLTHRAYKDGRKLKFPEKPGLPLFRIECPGLTNRKIMVEIDRESGLMRNIRTLNVGVLADIDDPTVLKPMR